VMSRRPTVGFAFFPAPPNGFTDVRLLFTDRVPSMTSVTVVPPTPSAVAEAVRELRAQRWDEQAIRAHAGRFSEARFIERIRAVAGFESGGAA